MRDETRLAVRRTGHWSIGWFLFLAAALALCVFLRTALAQPTETEPAVPVPEQPSLRVVEVADSGFADPATALPDVIEEIKPGEEVDFVLKTASALRVAADEKLWGPFASIVIMALLSLFSFVFLRVRDLRDKLKPYMAEVALGISVLGYVALGLGTLPAGANAGEWWGVIGPGIKTGLAAVGGYELLVKRALRHWWPKLWALVKRSRVEAS